MKNISFVRIKNLIIHYLVEHWKRDRLVFLFVLLMPMVMKLLCEFNAYFLLSFMGVLFVVMTFAQSSKIFAPLSKKNQQLHYLMLPASTTEKVIANLSIVYCFQTLVMALCAIGGLYLSNIVRPGITPAFSLTPIGIQPVEICSIICLFIGMQAVMSFGSVYFKKKALPKTVLCLFLFILLSGFVIYYLSDLILSEYLLDIVDSQGITPQKIHYLGLTHAARVGCFFGVTILGTLFFWVLSYFRLKETEA
ncbi:MAG: hypothetical protein LBV46_01240 [Bacteroidales bacterium]|jgi:hypothetical protein|nr:hypothetical protein [Bacteroidales bacterium]